MDCYTGKLALKIGRVKCSEKIMRSAITLDPRVNDGWGVFARRAWAEEVRLMRPRRRAELFTGECVYTLKFVV
jgi:hypothetical protein